MAEILDIAKSQAARLLDETGNEATTLTARVKILGYATRIIEACETRRSVVRQETVVLRGSPDSPGSKEGTQ